MKKENVLTFLRSDYKQYEYLLADSDVYSQVSSFLLAFVSLEALYKKMLISVEESSGKKLTNQEKKHLSATVQNAERVMKYYGIEYDKELVDRVFGSNDTSYANCSVKKLRDKLAHGVNANVIRTIIYRHDQMMQDIESFTRTLMNG